mgnify:FL=1
MYLYCCLLDGRFVIVAFYFNYMGAGSLFIDEIILSDFLDLYTA